MPLEPETDQRLLELIHDLLPEDEAAELRARIRADAGLARAYAEAEQTSRLLREAARLESPRIALVPPSQAADAAAEPPKPRPAARPTSVSPLPWNRWAGWSVSAAAAALLLISISGWFYHRTQLADMAADHLRLQVTGPAELQVGARNQYTVTTTSVAGRPLRTSVKFAVYSAEGARLVAHTEETDEQGQLRISVPADLRPSASQGDVRLELAAGNDFSSARIDSPLPVQPVREATCLATDKLRYRPAEGVRFRSVSVSRFGLAPAGAQTIRVEFRDPAGTVVPGAALETKIDQGMASGELRLPATATAGLYTLAAVGPDGAFDVLREPSRGDATIEVAAEDGSSRAPPVEPVPRDLSRVDVTFYPEGGRLAADTINRVYFACRDSQGQPVDVSGRMMVTGAVAARVKTAYRGMGFFSIEPGTKETYRLAIDSPTGVAQQPALPRAMAAEVVLDAGRAVFGPGEPLEFNLRAAEEGLPLIAAAWCRGVQVGQQSLVAAAKANPVSIPLDDEASGLIRVAAYDYSASPPRLLAERLVFRHPARRLRLRIDGLDKPFSPGQRVELPIAVTDERGKPVSARLGVAVVRQAAAGDAATWPSGMAAHFLLGNDLADAADQENLDFYVSGTPQADAALDLFLGTWGLAGRPRTTTEPTPQGPDRHRLLLAGSDRRIQPPVMFDNLRQLQARYQKSLENYRQRRTRLLDMLTTISFFGGLGLVLLVAMLNLLNVASGVRVWAPSLGVALVCVVIGAVLLNPRAGPSSRGAVAFAPYHAGPLGRELGKAESADDEATARRGKAAGEAIADEMQSRVLGRAAAAQGAREEQPSFDAKYGGQAPMRQQAALQSAARGALGGAAPAAPGEQSAAPLAPERSPADRPAVAGRPATTKPVDVLLWEPRLTTDASGKSRIVLVLPDSPGVYRVQIDALGDGGRIASTQAKIEVK